MAQRLLLRLVLVVFAGLAGGCYESDFPLDSSPQVQTDARLPGAWRCVGPDPSDDAISITATASASRSYAITWEESGRKPDHYEGYVSSLKDSIVFSIRETPVTAESHWYFVHVVPLQANVAMIQMVHEGLLKGLDRAAVRTTLEQQRENPALYEEEPLVCIRAVK